MVQVRQIIHLNHEARAKTRIYITLKKPYSAIPITKNFTQRWRQHPKKSSMYAPRSWLRIHLRKKKDNYSSEKENSASQQLKSHGVRKKRCGVTLAWYSSL